MGNLDRAKLWSLFKANLLYIVFVFLVWAVAHPAARFNTSQVIDHEFPGDVGIWAVSGSHTNVKLEDDYVAVKPIVAKRSLLSKTYPLDQNYKAKQYIRIVAEYSGVGSDEQQVKLVEIKRRSILYVWFENNNQKRTGIHVLANISDTQVKRTLQSVVAIPAGSVNFNVGLLLRKPTIGIEVYDLVIDQLQHTQFYLICMVLLGIGFLVLVVRTGIWVWANNLFFPAMVAGLAITVLLAGVLMPGRFIAAIYSGLIAAVPALVDHSIGSSRAIFQNYGHFIGFFLLAPVALSLAKSINYDIADVMSKLFIFAIMTEVLQRHVVFRSSNLTDVFINSVGLILGAVCWHWCCKRKYNELA